MTARFSSDGTGKGTEESELLCNNEGGGGGTGKL
jgi:hypothetical protein